MGASTFTLFGLLIYMWISSVNFIWFWFNLIYKCNGYRYRIHGFIIQGVWKWLEWFLSWFSSTVNRIINASRNGRVTLQVYGTCLQMFDVCTLGHTAHIKATVQFLPHSDQHVRCADLHSRGMSVLQIKSGMPAVSGGTNTLSFP